MRHRKTIAIILSLAMTLLLATAVMAEEPKAAAAPAAPAAAPPPPKMANKVGDAVVDFTLPDSTGKEVKFSTLLGKKATVLVYSQSACSACRGEVEALVNVLEGKKDISLVVVMVDIGGAEMAKKFVDRFRVDAIGKSLYDKDFKTGPVYNVTSTPGTILIKDGKVAQQFLGFDPNNPEVVKAVSKL